ncbi:MAG: hypothetical protein AAFY05_23795 [Pseudomonadota bacterium]
MSIDKRQCGRPLFAASAIPGDGISPQKRSEKTRFERQPTDGVEEFCLIPKLPPSFHPAQIFGYDILEFGDFNKQDVLPIDLPDINVLNDVPRDRLAEIPRVVKSVGSNQNNGVHRIPNSLEVQERNRTATQQGDKTGKAVLNGNASR